jgi:hypothetical protein
MLHSSLHPCASQLLGTFLSCAGPEDATDKSSWLCATVHRATAVCRFSEGIRMYDMHPLVNNWTPCKCSTRRLLVHCTNAKGSIISCIMPTLCSWTGSISAFLMAASRPLLLLLHRAVCSILFCMAQALTARIVCQTLSPSAAVLRVAIICFFAAISYVIDRVCTQTCCAEVLRSTQCRLRFRLTTPMSNMFLNLAGVLCAAAKPKSFYCCTVILL